MNVILLLLVLQGSNSERVEVKVHYPIKFTEEDFVKLKVTEFLINLEKGNYDKAKKMILPDSPEKLIPEIQDLGNIQEIPVDALFQETVKPHRISIKLIAENYVVVSLEEKDGQKSFFLLVKDTSKWWIYKVFKAEKENQKLDTSR